MQMYGHVQFNAPGQIEKLKVKAEARQHLQHFCKETYDLYILLKFFQICRQSGVTTIVRRI